MQGSVRSAKRKAKYAVGGVSKKYGVLWVVEVDRVVLRLNRQENEVWYEEPCTQSDDFANQTKAAKSP